MYSFTITIVGAGESGKSTIAKQLKIIHLNGFTPEEKQAAKSVIYSNIVTCVKSLVEAARLTGAKYVDEKTVCFHPTTLTLQHC